MSNDEEYEEYTLTSLYFERAGISVFNCACVRCNRMLYAWDKRIANALLRYSFLSDSKNISH